MYRGSEKQLKIVEFELPFEGNLSATNRWVVLSELVPWDIVEDEYFNFVSKKLGAPACSARMAFASLIIKERLDVSDRETVEMIVENPYLQYFIGLKKYVFEAPFDPSMMVTFRKRFSAKGIQRINEELHKREMLSKARNEDDDPGESPDKRPDVESTTKQEDDHTLNKGKLLLDATAVPSDITYPNDIKVLNSAREQTEKIIDQMHVCLPKGNKKPRTYRKRARKEFVVFSKKRRHSSSDIRKTRRKQLGYVERNLKSIAALNKHVSFEVLEARLYKLLLVCTEVARQQRILYDTRSTKIDDRIVNVFQPHIRPIKRGKAQASTEFGAKLSISLVDGYTFIDHMSFDNYNESGDLIAAAEAYRKRFGSYPESIHADKIYRNRANIAWCKANHIRLSGPKLGRPAKLSAEEQLQQKQIQRQDELDRIPVEGKFGQMKRRFGLDRIMTKLPRTTTSVIALTVFIANLEKVYKLALFFATYCIIYVAKLLVELIMDSTKLDFTKNETTGGTQTKMLRFVS